MRLARTILQPLLIAILLAVAVRSMLHIYAIPSASMQPTLEVGDHIVVLRSGRPERGDVIVFRSPTSSDELMVKRVIATPGDLVSVDGGRVTIGSHLLDEPYVAHAAASGPILPQIVPSDCYFVMGDNRTNSYDSRHWGVLPRQFVVGKAVMVLWSSGSTSDPRANATTLNPSPLVPAIRPERLFRLIH
jgi:signal peptidase I